MKAVRLFEYGGTGVLRYGDYPEPECGPRDVLVRVLATTISGFDVKYRRGDLASMRLPGRRAFPLPMQLGRDTAGVVAAVGAEVTSFAIGDRVIGLTAPANPLSPLSLMGLGNLSTDIDLPGHTMFGSNAQFVARPEHYWLPLPDAVDTIEAAAAMWAYSTSHHALADRLRMRFGDVLLIVGASGGMGTATLDLARAMGVRVIAVTRSTGKRESLRARGAAEVVVLDGVESVERIRAAAGPLGVDAAIDYSGDPAMIRTCIDTLRPGGALAVVAGEASEAPLPITARDCVRLELSVHGVRSSNISDQQAVVRLLAQGAIHPAVARVMPLAEVAEAHRMLEAGGVEGRIVLEPWS
jgi:putative oxidoreductase